MIVSGKITAYDGHTLTITAPFDDIKGYIHKQHKDVEIRLVDGRTISTQQRKAIYATFRDISVYTGHEPDEIKELMKYDFIAKTGCAYFSLSDVDVTTANEFLSHLIEFCIEWEIATQDVLLDRSPDVARYLYICLLNRVCCLCGRKAETHHTTAVGMGRNRNEIDHIGMSAMSLCRDHHMEVHSIGQPSFDDKYHVFGVKIDDRLASELHLNH